MKNLSSSLAFTIDEKTYSINFPNNREYIQIHNNKALLASQYAELQFMGAESQFAESLVDTISHLSVLCPALIKDLNTPIQELSLIRGKELLDAYSKQFRPWYNENLNYIFGINKEDKDIDNESTTTESSS